MARLQHRAALNRRSSHLRIRCGARRSGPWPGARRLHLPPRRSSSSSSSITFDKTLTPKSPKIQICAVVSLVNLSIDPHNKEGDEEGFGQVGLGGVYRLTGAVPGVFDSGLAEGAVDALRGYGTTVVGFCQRSMYPIIDWFYRNGYLWYISVKLATAQVYFKQTFFHRSGNFLQLLDQLPLTTMADPSSSEAPAKSALNRSGSGEISPAKMNEEGGLRREERGLREEAQVPLQGGGLCPF